jgi:hypothetical protein
MVEMILALPGLAPVCVRLSAILPLVTLVKLFARVTTAMQYPYVGGVPLSVELEVERDTTMVPVVLMSEAGLAARLAETDT